MSTSRRAPVIRTKRTNSASQADSHTTPKTKYGAMPQQELSLVAYFDDMVRLRDNLLGEIDMLHEKLKLSIAQMDNNRREWKTDRDALEKERARNKQLEEELARTNVTLKQVREAYRKEVMQKENIKKERNDFLEKLQTVKDYLDEDRNLDKAKILQSLTSLHTLIEVDENENSATTDSLSLVFDKTEEDAIAERRRSSGASKRRSAPREDDPVGPHSPSKRPPPSYETNERRLSSNTGHQFSQPGVHFNPEQVVSSDEFELDQTQGACAASNQYVASHQASRRSMRIASDPDGREELPLPERHMHHATVGGISEFRAPSRESDAVSITSTTSLSRRSMVQNHVLALKKFFKSETCNGCNRKITFCVSGYKCSVCHSSCHTECRDKLPKCTPYIPPQSRRGHRLSIAAFVQPKVRPSIPALVYHLVEEIESRNLKNEGLYRVGAGDREIAALTEKLVHSKHGLPSLKDYELHLLANVLKRFLRDLDEPLVTRVLWRDFVNAAEKKDSEERKTLLIQAMTELPPPNRDTLIYLIEHFHRVIQATEKMDIRAIARVFAPTLVGHSMVNPPVEQILAENQKQINVLESLLTIPLEIWGRFGDDEQVSIMKNSRRSSLGTRILGGNCTIGHLSPYRKPQDIGGGGRQISQSGLTLKPLF